VQVTRTCKVSEPGKIGKLNLLNLQFRKMKLRRCYDGIKSVI
jgi:hypothetical protein